MWFWSFVSTVVFLLTGLGAWALCRAAAIEPPAQPERTVFGRSEESAWLRDLFERKD